MHAYILYENVSWRQLVTENAIKQILLYILGFGDKCMHGNHWQV
jgi:hypothetical protein